MVRVKLRNGSGPGWAWLSFRPDGLSQEAFRGSVADYAATADGDPQRLAERDQRLSHLMRIPGTRNVIEVVADDDPATVRGWMPPTRGPAYIPTDSIAVPRREDPRTRADRKPTIIEVDVFGRPLGAPRPPEAAGDMQRGTDPAASPVASPVDMPMSPDARAALAAEMKRINAEAVREPEDPTKDDPIIFQRADVPQAASSPSPVPPERPTPANQTPPARSVFGSRRGSGRRR